MWVKKAEMQTLPSALMGVAVKIDAHHMTSRLVLIQEIMAIHRSICTIASTERLNLRDPSHKLFNFPSLSHKLIDRSIDVWPTEGNPHGK